MAAPVFQAFAQGVNWSSTTTPKTASVTDGAGDVLVDVAALQDGTSAIAAPTTTGLVWTQAQFLNAGNFNQCVVGAWTTTDSAGGSRTVSQTETSGAGHWGLGTFRFSGSSGPGASSGGNAAAGTTSITTTQANSAIVVIAADWSGASGTTRTWATINGTTPTAGNGLETFYLQDGTNYTIYVGYYPDAGAAGTKTAGITSPSGTFTTIAVEVTGAAGGSNSGPNSPSTGTDLGGGTGTWTSPGNVTADDGSLAVWTVI